MEANNNFSAGMESDISKIYQKPNSYLQALNFRAQNELGGSNGSLVNIKGNNCAVSFPILRFVYKLKVFDNDGGGGNETITITINGQVTGSIVISPGTTGKDLYDKVVLLSNCYNNPTSVTPTFAVAYDDNFLIIYQQPVYKDCGPAVESVEPVITIGTIIGVTADWTVGWVDIANLIQPNNTNTPYVTPTNVPVIIGSTFIDEDIYLFVESYYNGYSVPPNPATNIPLNDSFTGVGLIWKLSINDTTKQSTLTLLYSNYLDFTKYHPIPPSAVTGRYESDTIKRIYWTDYYNKIRTLNVANPNLMAFDPNLLSVVPSISFELPILVDFIGGSLAQGTYELSYRLKKANTTVSNFAQSSNMVNLLSNPNGFTDSEYISFEGPATISNSSAGIRWMINNIDTNFDTIQLVITYRNTKTNLPTVYISKDEGIGNYTSKIVDVTTLNDFTTISIEEYINVSSGFTHAKTVDTKDNRLFWGNVYSAKSKDISSKFDARAFRAKTSGDTDIKVINAGTLTSYANLAVAIDSPITNDSINPYYDSLGVPDANACYYQPGTAKLGGKGANIAYEFGTENILLSDLASTEGSSGDWLIRTTVPFNMKASTGGIGGITNPEDLILGTTDSDDQLYTVKGIGTSKNTYFTSVLKGYQHEEIYRFGIQFFDLGGNPFFTEWIGDIKMPGYGDVNDNPGVVSTSLGIADFRNSFLDTGSTNIYGQSLYVKFTVDVSSIQDLISGYQIVRVERTDNNKSILGCGMLTNPFVDTTTLDAVMGGGLWRETQNFPNAIIAPFFTTGIPYNPYPNQGSIETLSWATNNQDSATAERMATFDCFDFMTNGYSFQTGDKVLIRAKTRPSNRQNAMNGTGDPRYRIGFDQGLMDAWLDNSVTVGILPNGNNPVWDGASRYITGFDSEEMPYYLLFYDDYTFYTGAGKVITKGMNVGVGDTITAADTGVVDFKNYMRSYGPQVDASQPADGSKTVLLTFDSGNAINSGGTPYFADDTNGEKLIALYYRPNLTQYGGNTYSARTNNSYIACGSYIPVTRNRLILSNNLNIAFKNFGGDVHLNYWDHQKLSKSSNSTTFKHYSWSSGNPGSLTGITQISNFNTSVTCYFACTNTNNQNVRYGDHIDTQLTVNTYNTDDSYDYRNYHSNEKNVIEFFPRPLNFILNDRWINRVHYSQIKINNETEDNWAVYPTNQFYDVEGNYGGINCIISLNNQLHFLQDRATGMLIINPVAMIDAGIGANIKLGVGDVIQRHQYRALDIGTKHQWSVYKSQSQIVFADIRHKKLYSYNGEQITPISDTLGQRNYFIKRFHGDVLTTDNPVISKGILTTYDYYHNEFIITIVNDTTGEGTESVDEYTTISYSELIGKFVSMYSFKPNIYINNHKYLFSNINSAGDTLRKSIYLHNYGAYGSFYGTVYPSRIKVLCNDNPLYTKVFDNLTWLSESIKDNIEWSDDLNLYPGSITSPSYVDDVNNQSDTFNSIRCYNDWQNTDFTTLTLAPPNNNLTRKERNFNLQIPRNKFNYDTTLPSTVSLFDPSKLNKLTYGERIRDKFMIVDLSYANSINNRFIIHNLKTKYRISDR